MKTKTLITAFIATILVLSFNIGDVFAGLSVKIPVIETKVKPGKKVSGKITVNSTFNEAVTVNVQPENWKRYVREDKNIDVSEWLKIEPKKFVIKAGKSKTIKYTAQLPKDIKGEVMAMAFLATLNPGNDTVAIGTRFGIAIYVAAEGTERFEAIADSFTLRAESRAGKDGYTVFTTVKNTGNVHFRPRGHVVITDLRGEKVCEAEFQYGWPLFPGQSHAFDAFIETTPLQAGKYRANISFNFGDIYPKVLNLTTTTNDLEVDDKGVLTPVYK